MSGQIKLKSASLGGDITLAPTDTASNLVVTIPAVTATLLNNLSDIEAQVKTATSATGSAPIFSCRAWVNFNGTGTVAIRASGNVSSITDNGTGDYTVNFTTAIEDANYCALVSVSNLTGPNFKYVDINNNSSLATTTACRLIVLNLSNVVADEAHIYFSLFR